MEKTKDRLPKSERQATIRRLLRDNQTVAIVELADTFGVSEMTIRRDLDTLVEIDDAPYVRGGVKIEF